MVDWCIVTYGESAKKLAPIGVRPLLFSLAKPFPVCAILPPTEEIGTLVQQQINTDVKHKPELLQSLQRLSPVLFNVVKTIQFKDCSLPRDAQNIDLDTEFSR